MKPYAYIETVEDRPAPSWLHAAKLGFWHKGYEIIEIKHDSYYDSVFKNPTKRVLIGGIDFLTHYFKQNDIVVPKPLNVPVELNTDEFLGRSLRVIPMGKFKEMFTRYPVPIFIKPYDKVKGFDSGVLDSVTTMNFNYEDVSDDTLVQTSSLVDFVAEYRCFVHEGVLKGIHFYKGDCTIFPNVATIGQMIRTYTEAPIAYTLDVGVVQEVGTWGLKESKTLLVECNDMWSVDNYGFDFRAYSTMLRDRWFEIIKNKK